jgi:membrane fusion protein, heavy metal efflux system
MGKSGVYSAILSLVFLGSPVVVLAHSGHGDEFQGESKSQQSTNSIQVDAETAKKLGIEVEAVSSQRLNIAIKTTGQIETLPNQKVEVKAPVDGILAQLLVKPGDRVKKSQPIAVLSSSELGQLRVDALGNQANARSELQKGLTNLNLAKTNYQRLLKISQAEIAQANIQLTAAQNQYERERSLIEQNGVVTLAQESYLRQVKIAQAEIEQAKTELAAAQTQYDRDKSLVDRQSLVAIAKENYQRQVKISESEINQAETELAVAQEQYDRDLYLFKEGALPRRQMLESKAHLAEGKTQLAKAQQRQNVLQAETEVKRAQIELPFRELRDSQARVAQAQAQLAKARQRLNVLQAETEVKRAQIELPFRELRSVRATLAEAQLQLTKAMSRPELLEAEAQVKRAQSEVQAAQSRLNLASTAYQTRLKQLGAIANEQGLVTVIAPITGTVADREVTLEESVKAADKPLMTILNDVNILATANIYEKDINKVEKDQAVRVKVASLPNETFSGRITVIGSVVEGETRVIPVKAAIDNSRGLLKPGMFAELEVFTNETSNSLSVIPSAAVVEANGKQIVYVQNGNAYQSVEVTLGQTSGDKVEVKTGLFEGDLIVTQRAPQLYAQSLRAGNPVSKKQENQASSDAQNSTSTIPWWWMSLGAGAIGVGTFLAGVFWARQRVKRDLILAKNLDSQDDSDRKY